MMIEVYSPTIRRKEMDAVLTAMVEDKIGPGEQARLLIQIAKDILQFEYCMALRSPAIVLYLALKGLNLEDGQGVVLSALAPRYYGQVLADLRLVPLYCDVSQGIPVISPQAIEAALSRKEAGLEVRCILVNQTLGYVPDMAGIAGMGLPVIEDCSQSFTIPAEGARNGAYGTFTMVGLEERDMLTAGGGALLYAMNRRDAAVLRNLSILPEYTLPDLNAAMAVIQCKEAPKNLEKRRKIAQVYAQAALRTRHKQFIPREEAETPGGEAYNHYAFPLVLETGMKDVKAYAKRKDIAVESAFEHTLMGSSLVPAALCPEAYSLFLRTVLFPLYPRLGAEDVEKIAKLIMTLP